MINLRTYSRFSLKHSIASIESIAEKAKADGDTHIAILDKGGIHSTIYLAKEAKKLGLEPMIGYEFSQWLTLWPTSAAGLVNLNKIATKESKGASQYTTNDVQDIIAVISEIYLINDPFVKLFKDIYFEIEEHLSDIEKQNLEQLAIQENFKIIPTSIVLYSEQGDALPHDYFYSYIWKNGRHLPNDNYFIKSKSNFITWAKPEWMQNIKDLAQRIKLNVQLGLLRLPEFDGAPQNVSNFEFLEKKCREALHEKRFTSVWVGNDIYEDRLDTELHDIKNAHLESYFLIVEDMCSFAKRSGIKMGRGRGSAAGSLVCYLLGITGIDPIKNHLIWERFYNAGRSGSLPDIDTDFEKDRRGEVINYLSERWGKDSVFQIITFGSFGPSKAIKVAMNIAHCGFEEQNEVSKLVHHKAENLKEALEKSPELREEAGRRKAIFQIAEKIEGSYESFGKHAAGIIISDKPFTDGGLPMTWHEDDQKYISAYDLGAVEEYGLLKIDCLGLNTLDIIKRCEILIRERHKPDFKIEEIPFDDQDVYKAIFEEGKTKCIFQLESQLGQKYSKLLKPKNIKEIADLVTVVRPGAMEPGQTQQYLDVRDGLKTPTYPHPKLENILKDTYSACIYQEQVMRICTDIAGLDLQTADIIRKAAGKKKPELMAKQKDIFLKGCAKEQVTSETAEILWSWIVEFAGYGFNLAHAVGYAYISYETAWLKYHYTIEFYEASLNYVVGDLKRSEHDKIREIIYDAKEFNIDVKLPSIKECNPKFKILNNTTISYGLTIIKGIGDSQMPIIEKCKDIKTFSEFLTLALKEGMRKDVIEALICSGALDHFGLTRNTMRADYELINGLTDREYLSITQEVNGKSALDIIKEMCDESKADTRKLKKVVVPNKTRREKLRNTLQEYKVKDKFESILHIAMYEREFLGCDISVNETDGVFASITHNLLELKKLNYAKAKVRTAIHIDFVRKITTKKGKNPGQEMAFITGSDGTAIYDSIVVFPKQYQRFKDLLTEGRVIFIDGETSDSGLIVNNLGILK